MVDAFRSLEDWAALAAERVAEEHATFLVMPETYRMTRESQTVEVAGCSVEAVNLT
jgi:hypothetical protein